MHRKPATLPLVNPAPIPILAAGFRPEGARLKDLQKFLERMDSAIVQRDWAAYRLIFDLPFVLVDSLATKTYADELALRRVYAKTTLMFGSGSGREILHVAVRQVMLEPKLMHGTFESHVFDQGHRCAAPFLSTVLLRQVGDAWRMTLLTSRVTQLKWADAETMNQIAPVGSVHSD